MKHEIAFGSVLGTEHARMGRNNQDAVCVRILEDRIVAVVCDGCSSGIPGKPSHNEIGAQIGARIVAFVIESHLEETGSIDWRRLIDDAAMNTRLVLGSMGAATSIDTVDINTVLDMFLFTTVVAVVTKEHAVFAALGDGIVFVNDEQFKLGPFPRNEPPYLAYKLVPSTIDPALLQFCIIKELPADELESFFIGTDGTDDLISAEKLILPGGSIPVGTVSQLWKHDKYFKNPDAIRRFLTLVNGGVDRLHPGYLKDDTSFVVGRKRAHG